MVVVKLIVGLGNPGREYERTPHNVGFAVVDALAERQPVRFKRSLRWSALVADARVGGEPVLLVKPQTYMNSSGVAVAAVVRYYKLAVGDLTVVVDDADLPVGRLRVRARGGSGGHKGLASLIAHLQDDAFARVRVGIGRARGAEDLVDHVLAPFSAAEARELAPALERAAEAVACVVRQGVDAAMNAFNAAAAEQV